VQAAIGVAVYNPTKRSLQVAQQRQQKMPAGIGAVPSTLKKSDFKPRNKPSEKHQHPSLPRQVSPRPAASELLNIPVIVAVAVASCLKLSSSPFSAHSSSLPTSSYKNGSKISRGRSRIQTAQAWAKIPITLRIPTNSRNPARSIPNHHLVTILSIAHHSVGSGKHRAKAASGGAWIFKISPVRG
jgi:hypothetical protein